MKTTVPRGQTALVELSVGAFLVLLMVFSLTGFWTKSVQIGEQSRFLDRFERLTRETLSVLVQTGGRPAGWDAPGFPVLDVNSFGLVQFPLVLRSEKLRAFAFDANRTRSEADYNASRRIMGLGDTDFQFRVFVFDPSSGVSAERSWIPRTEFWTGDFSVSGEQYVMAREQLAVLDNQQAKIEMRFFYPVRLR